MVGNDESPDIVIVTVKTVPAPPPPPPRKTWAERIARVTRVFIIVVVASAIAYDVVAMTFWRGPATISTQIGNWLATPYLGYVLAMLWGVLSFHLFAMMPADAPNRDWRLTMWGVGLGVGYWITPR